MSTLVIVMMQTGSNYTGAILLPFASTFFVFSMILSQRNRKPAPNTNGRLSAWRQNKTEKKILSIYRSHLEGNLDLSEAKNAIERVLIQSALHRSNNNVSLAANSLGIKRSTLYSIFNRLDIDRQATED